MRIKLDIICINILEILAENTNGLGIAVLDRKLYDKIGYEIAVSLNFRTGDKLRELQRFQLITDSPPYKLTEMGNFILNKNND